MLVLSTEIPGNSQAPFRPPCSHANTVREAALQFLERRGGRSPRRPSLGAQCAPLLANMGRVKYRGTAQAGTFFARDNVSNFIAWCRQGLDIMECLLFETDDLCLRKNEKHVILCLLEVARRGARLGMPAPVLVQMEREIDRELAAEQRAMAPNNAGSDFSDEEDVPPISIPQIVTNDLKSLDEMTKQLTSQYFSSKFHDKRKREGGLGALSVLVAPVCVVGSGLAPSTYPVLIVRDLVERCKCPVQFPMIRVSEGKYRIGDTKVLIFVRILRKHVMVRVGGGWDTLSHYLDKHDPCRCKTAHRSPINAKLVLKSGGANMDLGSAHVYYDRSPPRTRRSSASSVGSTGGGGNVNMASLIPAPSQAGGGGSRNRSRSRSPSHAPALRPPSFRSSTHCLVQEPSATPTDTPLNDSSSEVSDEGYRSLGPLVMTPQSSTHISDVNTPLNTNANNLGIPKNERVHWESSTLDYKVTDASRKA
uniref:GAR domain-containing protein n=1 Tax=Timema monikensis TaxID=170555 RepID=A0A7R9E342_9NEOP|nr:unnamed protein product [Timema monikensis]